MASVPLPHQFAVGELVTADNLNTYYSGISFLENPPVLQVYASGTQSVTNAFSVITLDTPVVDSYNGFNASNHQYTAQVPGYYVALGYVAFLHNAAATGAFAAIYKNGAAMTLGNQGTQLSTNIDGIGPFTYNFVQFNGTTDYIELRSWASNATTTLASTQFSTLALFWFHS